MGGLTDSSAQKRLDPASMFPSYCNASLLNPRKKTSHLSPKKTKKLKLYQTLETFMDKQSDGLLSDKHSDVNNRSTDICNNKRAARHNHSNSFCGTEGEKLGAVNIKGMEVQEEKGVRVECSMCGDVGIAEFLFLCSECSLRRQHTYCGRSYPNLGGKASICNWCLHEQDSSMSSAAKESAIHAVEELRNPAPVRVNQGYSDEALIEITGRHGKAFDYLLLIAAQSSLPQVFSKSNDEIKQAASVINITGPPRIIVGSADNEAIYESDKKAFIKTGLSESKGSSKNQARIKLNMEIQGAVTALKVEGRMDPGAVAGENMHKRQRCSKGVDVPAFKCRKRGLQVPTSAKSNFRRYKLLADVVC